jgi:hypothetical protein
MTGAVLDRPMSHPGTSPVDDGLTLERLLTSAFDEVQANGSTECPVCHARMSMTSTRARKAGGDFAAECGGCGSRLD